MNHAYETETDPQSLNQLSEIAGRQQKAEDKVLLLEDQLKAATTALREISEKELPALMDEIGMEEFVTTSGLKISVREKIRAKIPEARNAEAILWLEENGHGGLVKRLFTVEFDRDEMDWAKDFERECAQRERPLRLKRKEGVHGNTLSAFVKEQLADGENLPLGLLGVFRQRFAKITRKE